MKFSDQVVAATAGMRAALFFLLVSGGAALPIQSVPLTRLPAARGDRAATEDRVLMLSRFYAPGEAAMTAEDLEVLTDLLGESLPITFVAAGRTGFLLFDGRFLQAARIVAISETIVTVLHAEGLADVEIERVPVELLKRARTEIAATAAALKAIEAEVEARAAERIRESEARRLAELQERLALATARPDLPEGARAEIPRQVTDPLLRLLALQERFPARKKGKNQLGIEFDLPIRSVWSFYNSYFLATTLDQLPETLAILEARLTQDLAAWDWKAKSSASIPQSAEHVQAQQTVLWLSETLRAYLQEARQLTRAR